MDFRWTADSYSVTFPYSEAQLAALQTRLANRLPAGWRTRFAPAPTGGLHLGHAVNAVYVWSIARAFGGSVLLRIEDHDRLRSRARFDAAILDDLAWLGLEPDNATLGFPQPLRQSEDGAVYEATFDALDRTGRIYACRCSRRGVATHAMANEAAGETRYPGTCRDARVPAETTLARRMQLDRSTVRFEDVRHGPCAQVPASQCGDLLLRDRNGQWTYQYSVVVDDLRQGVNVVIRGDDLLQSTGRQVLLARALGHSGESIYLHHPLVVHADGVKLSKSNEDTALSALRDGGWNPAKLLGHAAWLGGLQAAPDPLPGAEIGRLWDATP